MNENKLSSDCLQKIDSIYQKFENELDHSKTALQLQLDRAYATIYASEEAKAAAIKFSNQKELSQEILNYIASKNASLLKIIA